MTRFYTTVNEDGSPVTEGTLPESVVLPSRPEVNILSMLQLMMESKLPANQVGALATMVPGKWSPDLLVETYFKYANLVMKLPPQFSSIEQVQQTIRENLRQKVHNTTGINIPGTFTTSYDFVPFVTELDSALPVQLNEMLENLAGEYHIDCARPAGTMQSVASVTADWLQRLRGIAFTHNYHKLPDILIQDTRAIEFGPRKNVRNPALYPKISLIATENLGFVFDIFINGEKLDVFAYGSQAPHQATVPPSLITGPFTGLLPVEEMAQYQRGLALALIKIRDVVLKARTEDRRTKTVAEVVR